MQMNMLTYKGFEFYYDPIIRRLAAWSKDYEISISMFLTECQECCLVKLFGNNGPKDTLINNMKRWINNYLKYIEEQNEFCKTKV